MIKVLKLTERDIQIINGAIDIAVRQTGREGVPEAYRLMTLLDEAETLEDDNKSDAVPQKE